MRKVIFICDACKKELKKDSIYYLSQERKVGTLHHFAKSKAICKDCFKKIELIGDK